MTTVFHRLGPYEITREIGRGGMAVVFLAVDTRTGREAALKTVPQGTDREGREVFEAEQGGAELQRQFSAISDHVPAVYEHGVDESGYFYVAMEYLDGENLSDVISRGPLTLERAVGIAIDLCRFLEQAHGFEANVSGRTLRSLLHGDLKPRNVRITAGGKVKVLDFGIAKALSLSRKVTRNDFGSVAYLSPERLETGEVDAHADFWALGVLLYEMLSGTAPFQAPDTRRLEKQIMSRQPPPSLAQRCPASLEAVVCKLLAPTPAERYGTAQAIREDLERFAGSAQTIALEEGWPRRAKVDEQSTRRTRPADVAEDEKTRRTRPPSEATAPQRPATPLPMGVPPIPTAPTAKAAVRAATPAAKPARRSKRFLRIVLAIAAFSVFINEARVGNAANDLIEVLPTREIEQLGDVWTQFDNLSRRSYFRFSTMGLERSLVDRTMTLADRVVANYRTASPAVREAQWRTAREVLARALGVAPGNRQLRASLRYCEGHLHRINGEAQKARQEDDGGQRELTEAVAAFREAAQLRPGWADPFLGLVRTFVSGLEDVDRGADALRQAQRNGYTANERETAQIADGYRARGNALVRNAKQLTGMAQERDYLTRAAEAYRQSLELYGKATGFANVPFNIRLSQRALSQVEQRLEEIEQQAKEPPLETIPWV
jgi:eukaryotic-like serine/threonine-protein kinase